MNFQEYLTGLLTEDKKELTIINATPHDITFKGTTEIVFKKSDIVARVETKSTKEDFIEYGDETIPLYSNSYGDIVGLPKAETGTLYIVSALVLSANKEGKNQRNDLIAPDTSPNGGAVRENGQIKAVTRFVI